MSNTISGFISEQIVSYALDNEIFWILGKDSSVIKKNLDNVIEKTICEYNNEYAFHLNKAISTFFRSQCIINEIIKFRIFKNHGYRINSEIISKEIEIAPAYIFIKKDCIDSFLDVLEQYIRTNELLSFLAIDKNYKSEVFSISKAFIDEIENKTKSQTHTARLLSSSNDCPQDVKKAYHSKIKIFLASSFELKDEREQIEIYINRINKKWIEQGTFIELVIWEDFIDSVSHTRSQDEYNNAICNCDAFVMIYFSKVGMYTVEEFETAYNFFKKNNKPYIFIFYKNDLIPISIKKEDIESVWKFRAKLKELGHFPTEYRSIEELKLKLLDQIEKTFFDNIKQSARNLDYDNNSDYEKYSNFIKKDRINVKCGSSEILFNISIDDLDEKEVENYFNLERVRKHIQEHEKKNDDNLIEKFESLFLINDGNVIKGTFLCLGKGIRIPGVSKSASKSQFFLYEDNNGEKTKITEHIYGNLIVQYNAIIDHLKRNLYLTRDIDIREDDYEIPKNVFLELVANAFIHRDYSNENSFVKVEVYPNRIEIYNPGEFPETIKYKEPEKIENSVVRNFEISCIFFSYGYTENAAQGIKRCQSILKKNGFQPAVFEQKESYVKATVFKKDEAAKKKINVIIVDDHDIFRKGLRMMLEEIPEVKIIDEAANGYEFMELLKTKIPEIVLIDIRMPIMDGFDAISASLKLFPDIKFIVISWYGDEENLQRALELGAVGFLLKNINADEIRKAIYSVYDGNRYFSEELMSILANKYINFDEPKENTEDIIKTLSSRDLEILNLICKGLTNNEIAEACNLSLRTVDGYRARMIEKVGATNTVGLVVFAIKNKLVNLE